MLFIGLGSVGQRHLRNVKTLLGSSLELIAVRSRNRQFLIESGKERRVADLAVEYGYQPIVTLEEALALKPDFAVVSNPSSMHVQTAAKCVAAGVHCLIEKPVISCLSQLALFENTLPQRNVKVAVGYQFRFHPVYLEAKRVLRSGALGALREARFVWETYLPDHHPYEDYRESYAARLDLGGGALNGLSHDVDLMLDLLGEMTPTSAQSPSEKRLEMKGVEEAVAADLITASGCSVRILLSYAEKVERHGFEIVGERGSLECDLHGNRCSAKTSTGEQIVNCSMGSFDRNQLFLDEMADFIDCVHGNRVPTCSFEQGIHCMKVVEAIRMLL